MSHESSRYTQEEMAILAEADREAKLADPLEQAITEGDVVIFTSRSKGRGKRRQFPVDVILLKSNRGYTVYSPENGPSSGADSLAEQMFNDRLPPVEDSYQCFEQAIEARLAAQHS